MTAVNGSSGWPIVSVAEATTDVGGRYGGDCKTAYTGSSPLVARTTTSTLNLTV